MSIDLSIIIINWNSKDYLKECLNSIYKYEYPFSLEIIVVDNASFDGSKDVIDEIGEKIIFIQNDKNSGFAKANNLGFMKSNGRNVLFLNPDTKLINDAISILYYSLEDLPDAGAVGGTLINSDGTIQMSSVKNFPSILNIVLDSDLLRKKFPKLKLWGMKPLFDLKDTIVPVQVVSGACIMIKRDLFEKIGGFNEEYFMYSEDVELSYQISQCGFNVYYVKDAKITHHGGKITTSLNSINQKIINLESKYKYFEKIRGPFYARFFKLCMILNAFIRFSVSIFISILLFMRNKGEKKNYTSVKWRSILSWSLGQK